MALAAACGGDGGEPDPAATATASTVTAPASPVDSLRDVDFTSAPFAGELIGRAGGGEVPSERVHFEDLTGDGTEEAVVVVESGGTAGDVGVAVYRLVEGLPSLLFFSRLAGRVEVRLGTVVTQEGAYGEGDPPCCPSRLLERVFGWDGAAMALLSEQVVPNPRR